MKKIFNMVGFSSILLASLSSHVYAQGTPFTVVVSKKTRCTVIVNRNGILAPNADSTVLSSKLPGGVSGEALVTPENGNHTVSAIHYGIWRGSPEPITAPNTIFQPSHSGIYNGNVLYPETTTPIRLRPINKPAAYIINVHLVATKTNGQSFAQGDYDTEVAVLCE